MKSKSLFIYTFTLSVIILSACTSAPDNVDSIHSKGELQKKIAKAQKPKAKINTPREINSTTTPPTATEKYSSVLTESEYMKTAQEHDVVTAITANAMKFKKDMNIRTSQFVQRNQSEIFERRIPPIIEDRENYSHFSQRAIKQVTNGTHENNTV